MCGNGHATAVGSHAHSIPTLLPITTGMLMLMPCHARQITSTDPLMPHPQLDDAPALISNMALESGATVHESPVSYMAFAAQDSRATAILPPPSGSHVSFMLASMAERLLPLYTASSSDDQHALPRWDLARWEVSRSPLCPSVCEKKEKKKKATRISTHRILSHLILNYIKVHLTPTKCLLLFRSSLMVIVYHHSYTLSLPLSSVQPFLFAASSGQETCDLQLSRASPSLVIGSRRPIDVVPAS